MPKKSKARLEDYVWVRHGKDDHEARILPAVAAGQEESIPASGDWIYVQYVRYSSLKEYVAADRVKPMFTGGSSNMPRELRCRIKKEEVASSESIQKQIEQEPAKKKPVPRGKQKAEAHKAAPHARRKVAPPKQLQKPWATSQQLKAKPPPRRQTQQQHHKGGNAIDNPIILMDSGSSTDDDSTRNRRGEEQVQAPVPSVKNKKVPRTFPPTSRTTAAAATTKTAPSATTLRKRKFSRKKGPLPSDIAKKKSLPSAAAASTKSREHHPRLHPQKRPCAGSLIRESDLYIHQLDKDKKPTGLRYKCGGDSCFFAKRFANRFPRLIQFIPLGGTNNYQSIYRAEHDSSIDYFGAPLSLARTKKQPYKNSEDEAEMLEESSSNDDDDDFAL